ncbi:MULTISPECIES: hypothetical protein [Niastella]|uniref:Uncharacterized protein n=1 Tax=Niastella soli TaxID=2821487 RepID=A0ABS3YUY9_9BACT|nr:hypothetical protein [Niastella soli]MBO9201705.1 hypothetical protein [Niastella soli]
MADQEIIKHTKKILKVSTDHTKSWKHKLFEIIFEIFIIVFAVTLSLYLHERAQKTEEHHLQDEFLLGLKEDLQNDIKELSEDSLSYIKTIKGFRYFNRVGLEQSTKDSIPYYWTTLFSTADLQPNDSRFQGLKSAGKLYVINNKKLLNDILDLYQEKIPMLLRATNMYTDFKINRLVSYLEINLSSNNRNDNNLKELVKKSQELRNYLSTDDAIMDIIKRYHQVMDQSRLLIHKISKEVGE